MLVLVQDFEIGSGSRLSWTIAVDLDGGVVARLERLVALDLTADRHLPLGDRLADLSPGQVGMRLFEALIEAHPPMLLVNRAERGAARRKSRWRGR